MAHVRGTNNSEVLDQLDGTTNDYDFIEGFDGADTIVAAGGNDFIEGGNGGDTIYGGDGFDTISYANSANGVIIDLAQSFGVGGAATGDRIYNVENIFGSSHGDSLIGDEFTNELFGHTGDDFLDGGAGNDLLYGGEHNDTLFGGAGHDTLVGDAGTDSMSGGADNDTYYTDGGDTITELAGEGYDVVHTTGFSTTLGANVETLILDGMGSLVGNGNALGNTIYGNAIGNFLNGMDGADTILGGAGGDSIDGGNQDDMILGEADGDVMHGGNGNDAIAGGTGTDILFGDAGFDVLFGEDGSDLIIGGANGDILRGGLGGDLFSYNIGDQGDLIQGFNQGGVRDGIDLRPFFDSTGYTGTNPRGAGILQVLQNGADTDVYVYNTFLCRIEGVVAAAIDDSYFLFQ